MNRRHDERAGRGRGTLAIGGAVILAWAVCLAAGCGGPARTGPLLQSDLAGQWRGPLASRSTRDSERRFEDFSLTILPNGRFATLGFVDAAVADRAGQVLREGSRPVARVVQSDYRPDQSRLCLEFVGMTDEAGRPILSGGTATARLRADGQIEYHLFGYAMVAGEPIRCEAIYQVALLRRAPPVTGARSRPDD